MRTIAIGWICLAACGGAVTSAPPVSHAVARSAAPADPLPVDPIAALSPDDNELSWVVPGPMQLELGAPPVAAAGRGRPIEVGEIDQAGNLERIAVRLDHARFSVWIDRSHLLSVLARDQHLEVSGGPIGGGEIEVVLRAGARVRRLAHRDRATQIRYLGALQVEGWVPDVALRDHGPVHDGIGRVPTGRKTMMVIPGAVIRSAPRWAAGALAIMASGYFLDMIRDLDEAWTEVSYEDADVAVHGYVSRRDPPGHVHHWHDAEPAPVVVPNAEVASGTCLYARARGEPIGYIVGNRAVDLDAAGAGWWTLAIDTPWGPLGFAARGDSAADLAICAPPDAVPPAAAPAP
jgi:hypothetical protein